MASFLNSRRSELNEKEHEKKFVKSRHEQRDPIEDIPYLILAIGCMVAAVIGFCVWYPSEKIYNFIKKQNRHKIP